ncbi:hypothetical protein K439DRAFT_354522 [Ramaria rubella]|nr:hypothetical protein K439DRAFT_354522 [Ramaria rubella]
MTAVPIPPSIDATFGALYLGSILATVLYGFTTNQAYVYWHTYGGEDSTGTQMLVFGLWALDSLQVVLVVHMSWFYLVAGFGDPTILTDLVWSFCLELGVTVFVTFTVRALYMLQLWRLSDGNAYLVFPAFLFAAAQLGLGIQTTIHMLSDPTIDIIPSKPFQWILGTKCITSVLSDIIITTSMCYFLHASRTGFRRTDGLVNKLFVGAVNRGVVAMLMEAAVMITFLTMKSNFIFASLHLMLGKLHTSSLYALLIQRDTLRARQNRATTRSHPTRARIGGSVSGIAGDRVCSLFFLS